MSYIQDELKNKRAYRDISYEEYNKCSKEIDEEDGVKKIVPVEGKEDDFSYYRGCLNSDAFKVHVAEAMFSFDLPEGEINQSIEYVNKALESPEKFVFPDVHINNNKKDEAFDVMGEIVYLSEEDRKGITASEYLDYYNKGLTMAIENGKIKKEDLNPDFYQSKARSK